MQNVVCKQCGNMEDYRTEMKSNQLTAWCNGCGSFIKNIPQGKPAQFFFGKFKGKKVEEVQDKEYLKWFIAKTDPKPEMRGAIENQIRFIDYSTK